VELSLEVKDGRLKYKMGVTMCKMNVVRSEKEVRSEVRVDTESSDGG